jgi:hypothetical protein
LGVPFFQVGILVSGSPSNLAWLIFGLAALDVSAGIQFLFAAGLVLVSRLLGVALLALAGTLVPRARPLLSSALVLMPSTAHTRRPVDQNPEEAN